MRKTGSTSIQRTLVGLGTDQHVYADLGHPNHGNRLQAIFLPEAETRTPPSRSLASLLQGLFRPTGEAANDRARLDRNFTNSVARAANKTLIFSGEGIPRLFSESMLRVLKARLESSFDEVTVVAYVRPPASYVTSDFQQRVKSRLGRFALTASAPAYRRSFEKFDAVFGEDRVHLWKFDPGRFPGRCVVQDFCQRLGIDIPASRIVRQNDSISREALSMRYIFNKFAPRPLDRRDGRPLTSMVRGIGSVRFRLSPDLVSDVLEQRTADISWMERRLGEPLVDLGDPSPDDVCSEADLLHPGGVIEEELSKLPNWGRPDFRFRSFEEFARLADACRQRQDHSPEPVG